MKLKLSCLLLVASFMMHAQEKTNAAPSAASFTITKTELVKVKSVTDLVPSLNKDFTSLEYEVTCKIDGVTTVDVGTTNEFNEKSLADLQKVAINKKMYLHVLSRVNDKPYVNTYSFYVLQ
jgi:hypothetical protein